MLSKTDKIDLAVQQEIKNYKDSLNYVLGTIKSLQESINETNNLIQKNYATLHSQNVEINRHIWNIKETYKDLDKKISHIEHENFLNLEEKKFEINEIRDSGIHNNESIREIQRNVDRLWTEASNQQCSIEKNLCHFKDITNEFCYKIRKDITNFKNEMLSIPKDPEQIKDHLENKINEYKVESHGILREINVLKKENHITEKKIENLYTLINRLKNPEETL